MALFISSHICSSNLVAGNLVCNSRLKIFLPCAWIFSYFQPSSLVSIVPFSCTLSSGHLEMPSANVLSSPGMCFAMWHHPLMVSMRPGSLISSPARLYFAPPHYLPSTLHSHYLRVRVRRRRPFDAGHPLPSVLPTLALLVSLVVTAPS